MLTRSPFLSPFVSQTCHLGATVDQNASALPLPSCLNLKNRRYVFAAHNAIRLLLGVGGSAIPRDRAGLGYQSAAVERGRLAARDPVAQTAEVDLGTLSQKHVSEIAPAPGNSLHLANLLRLRRGIGLSIARHAKRHGPAALLGQIHDLHHRLAVKIEPLNALEG